MINGETETEGFILFVINRKAEELDDKKKKREAILVR